MNSDPGSTSNLRALKVLVACIEHGSISAAAREMGMSQSAASRTIHNLEGELGLELFRRTSEQAVATPDGLLVANWAMPLLAADMQLHTAIAALNKGKQRMLRIIATQTTAEILIPRWLAELKKLGSEIDSSIFIGGPLSVENTVFRGEADIGFAALLDPPNSLASAQVWLDRLCIVVLPTHTWAQGPATIEITELEHSPLVTRDSTSGIFEFFERSVGETSSLAKPTLEFTSNAAVKVAVRAGIGPALISRLAVAEEIESRAFTEITISGFQLNFGIYAVWDNSNPRRELLLELVRIACERSKPRSSLAAAAAHARKTMAVEPRPS